MALYVAFLKAREKPVAPKVVRKRTGWKFYSRGTRLICDLNYPLEI